MVRHHERGQSVAELAMLLPILLLIVLGCLDLGRVFAVRMALANGAREGARMASLYPQGNPEDPFPDLTTMVYEKTKEDILAQGLDEDSLEIEVQFSSEYGLTDGEPISVTTAYTLPVYTLYLFGGKPVVIKASNSMAIVGGY